MDIKPTEQQYLVEWRQKMIQIWQDRLDLMQVHQKGHLRSSVRATAMSVTQTEATLAFQFIQYGIYVDRGVGNGYRPGNGGDLQFLGKAYRRQHHLGRPREKKPWFSRSWYISVEVLKNHMAAILGDQFSAAFDNLEA